MKIEMEKNYNNKYLDEFIYMVINYKKIKLNPSAKLGSAIRNAIIYELVSLVFFIIFGAIYLFGEKETINLIVTCFFAFVILIATFYLLLLFNRIHLLKKTGGNSIFEINEEYVEIMKEDDTYRINLNDLQNVIINKNTICFIPKDDLKTFITISSNYKEKIIEFLKSIEKDNLIVDNT